MTLLQTHLKKQRSRFLLQRGCVVVLQATSMLAACWIVISLGILVAPRIPQFWIWTGAGISGLVLLIGLFWMIQAIIRVSSLNKTADYIERKNPGIGFKLRSALDFQDAPHEDSVSDTLKNQYVHLVETHLHQISPIKMDLKPWVQTGFAVCAILFGLLYFKGPSIREALRGEQLFSSGELIIIRGSISIFEPDYTGIPGRTLPLSESSFEAYPGSRIRINFEDLDSSMDYEVQLILGQNENIQALKKTNPPGTSASFEFLLEQDSHLALQYKSRPQSMSQPILFNTLEDRVPEIELSNHTEEGEINPRNPILIEADVRDDFAVKTLEWVVHWDEVQGASDNPDAQGNEKRIPVQVPPSQSAHFLSRNQWNVSDLVPEGTEEFSVFLEAKDNNPFNGPGVGLSKTLRFGISTPEKERREFMNQVRELLDALTHTLADNLVTPWTSAEDQPTLRIARDLGNSIQSGLIRSREITAMIESGLRNDSDTIGMDMEFFRSFRSRLDGALNQRLEMSQVFAELHYTSRLVQSSFEKLRQVHGREEVVLENLVYDLVLQLKLWAMIDMEQTQDKVEDTLASMEELLNNSENMELDELKKEIDKLMDQLMKQMTEMMQKAAQEMDMNMQEFMNQEAMQQDQQELDDLKKQLEEALKAGDMEKAKAILEAMKQAMEAMMNSMKQSVGEMTPEMKKMMEAMQELMGLLGALKEGEENLEGDTQELMRDIERQIAEKMPPVSQEMQEDFKKIIARILEILETLNSQLASKDLDAWAKPVIDKIGETTVQNTQEKQEEARMELEKEIQLLKRSVQFLATNGLDNLQTLILKASKNTEELGEFLEHLEFLDAYEIARHIKGDFFKGRMIANSDLPPNIQKETQAEQAFIDATTELQKIIDFLEQLQKQRDELSQQLLRQQQNGRPQELSQRQKDIEGMVPDFLEKYEEALKRFPMINQLKSIQNDMGNAGDRLGKNRLNSGLRYEQDALRKLGELQEQMKQMQQGQGSPMLPMPWMPQQRQLSQHGDPTGELFIPDEERKARQSALKDQILKKLQKNLPQSHSKEIKAYYESLMDK